MAAEYHFSAFSKLLSVLSDPPAKWKTLDRLLLLRQALLENMVQDMDLEEHEQKGI